MIDLHCHILPNIDDGPSLVADSVDMCKTAITDGITDIIATPHYLNGRHDVSLEKRDLYLEKINIFLHKSGLKLRIHPGLEVRLIPKLAKVTPNIHKLCINKSRYILIELPDTIPHTLEEELYEIQLKGYVPILAHPERYGYIQRNPDFLMHLVSTGVLSQITAQSLLGKFGENCRRCAELLVHNRTAHFVASDAHSCFDRPPLLSAAKDRITHIAGHIEAQAMFEERPRAVLRNRPVDVKPPLPSTPRTISDMVERLASLL